MTTSFIRKAMKRPDLAALPWWHFDNSAVQDIGKWYDKHIQPYPEAEDELMDRDTPDMVISMVNNGIQAVVHTTGGIFAPKDDRPIWDELARRHGDGHTGIELAYGLAHLLYCARDVHQQRYVAKVAGSTKRTRQPLLTPRSRSFITVKWETPTIEYIHRGDATGTRGPVCEHDVRGFWRKLASGKRVWVSPHKRGNPDIPRKSALRFV